MLIILLNLLLSLPGLWVPFYNIDELTNAIHARFINEGRMSLNDFLGSTYFLTHYLYAWVYKFIDSNTLVPIHIVHAIWKSLTILALYWAGKKLDDRKTGIWCALFYCVYSVSFMSKDFHTPSAESFSLLPATLCAGFIFHAINRQSLLMYFIAGIFSALATFYKAPMGVLIVAINVMLLVRWQGFFKKALSVNLGFLLVLIIPVLLITPFGEGFRLMYEKVNETHGTYIQSHADFTFLYWFLKFLIRSGLVLLCCFAMTVFAFYDLRLVFRFQKKHRNYWQKIFFLFIWLILMWFTIVIGKRVFYHYYVFLLSPLALLAGSGIRKFDTRLIASKASPSRKVAQSPSRKSDSTSFLQFVRKHIVFFMLLPASIFFIEGALNFSTRARNFDDSIQYIQENTKDEDQIYVWGNAQQLYFYGRSPATVYYWSDTLAGTSPGSPAMEYVRATRNNLDLQKLLTKDLQPGTFQKKDPDEFKNINGLTGINESELFTVKELLERIDHPYWQKVFADFLKNPPALFVDTAPANIRGFSHYPMQKYELLKRFIWDNYKLETVIDGLIFYRLKRRTPS